VKVRSKFASRPRRTGRRALALTAAGVLAGAAGLFSAALLLQACGSDTTSGKRVVLHTRLTLEPSAASGFTTAVGWTVTLSQAMLAMGPVYYFDGAPPLELARNSRDWQRAARWLGLGIAHAHPGHYVAGNAMGQMLEASSVDVLGGVTELPDGDGVSGTYRSARFTFRAKALGPLSAELGEQVALVTGSAEKEGEEPRFFVASAELADVARSAAKGQVEGCEFSEVDVETDGTVTIAVNPAVWFNLVDFSAIEPGSAEAPSSFPAGSQPKLAFAQGLAQLSAYEFSYSNP